MKKPDNKLITDFLETLGELKAVYEMECGYLPRQLENRLIPIEDFLKGLLKNE